MVQAKYKRSQHAGRNPLFRGPTKPSRAPRIWITAAVVLLLGGIGALLWAPYFRITRITVTASPSISPDRVRTFVERRIEGRLLGVLPLRSQFLVSTGSLASALRTSLAGTVTLRTVSVRRVWPDALRISIEEVGGAYVLVSGTQTFLLDPTGTIVNRVGTDPTALFHLVDPQSLEWAVGERALEPSVVAGLNTVRGTLDSMGITVTGAQLAEVSCYPDALTPTEGDSTTNANVASVPEPCDRKELVRLAPDITLTTAEGWTVTLLPTGDIARQVADLEQVLADKSGASRSTLHSIDVRIPGRAYLR